MAPNMFDTTTTLSNERHERDPLLSNDFENHGAAAAAAVAVGDQDCRSGNGHNHKNEPFHDPRFSSSYREQQREQQQQINESPENALLSIWNMTCILSTSFAYGCVMSTFFLITIPVECERINRKYDSVHKSVALAFFIALAGVTQLVSPVIGRISDTYHPPSHLQVGQRLPYYVVGAMINGVALMGMMIASATEAWIRYSVSFAMAMIGMNIMAALNLVLLADQVPPKQVGVANGVMAFLLVTGSIFGFGLFHSILGEDIQNMYGLYTSVMIVCAILTATNAHDKDVRLARRRRHEWRRRRRQSQQRRSQRCISNNASHNNSAVEDGTRFSSSSMSGDPLTSESQIGNDADGGAGNDTILSPPRTRRQKLVRGAVRNAKAVIVTPPVILRSMLVPMYHMTWQSLKSSYWIDKRKHHDFLVVTISRLFYYCGNSVQTFFLYFFHDVLHYPGKDAETRVAQLAIVGQISGALVCYPVGTISDAFYQGRRRPFVYVACTILALSVGCMVFATTLKELVILSLIYGLGNGIYLTMETSLAVDTLAREDKEIHANRRSQRQIAYNDNHNNNNHNYNNNGSERHGLNPDHGQNNGNANEEEDDEEDEPGSAQLLGVWGVAAFIGSALGPLIGGPLLYLVGGPVADAATKGGHHAGGGGSTHHEEVYAWAGYAVVWFLSCFYFACSAYALTFLHLPDQQTEDDNENNSSDDDDDDDTEDDDDEEEMNN